MCQSVQSVKEVIGRNRGGGRFWRSPKGPWWVEKLWKEYKAFHALGAGAPRERQRFIKACLEVGFAGDTETFKNNYLRKNGHKRTQCDFHFLHPPGKQ